MVKFTFLNDFFEFFSYEGRRLGHRHSPQLILFFLVHLLEFDFLPVGIFIFPYYIFNLLEIISGREVQVHSGVHRFAHRFSHVVLGSQAPPTRLQTSRTRISQQSIIFIFQVCTIQDPCSGATPASSDSIDFCLISPPS